MTTYKEPKIVGKKRTVDFVKTHPGCSCEDVAEATDVTAMAARHRLIRLAGSGYIRVETVANSVVTGGVRLSFYHLKDFDIDPEIFARYEKTRERDERAAEKRAERNKPVEVPAIFLMHQPPAPIRPRSARSFVNDNFERPPLQNNDGQGSGRPSAWCNQNTPLAHLCL